MRVLALLLSLFVLGASPALAQTKDPTPRIAVMTAFPPEIAVLSAQMQDRRQEIINGVVFTRGVLAGKPAVLFMSGVSMVNAAMTTQLVLDRFTVSKIVFSGVAGGVDPSLDVGDVVVSEQWGQYLEVTMARRAPDGFEMPQAGGGVRSGHANFGMMHPMTVAIARGAGPAERRFWFPADPAMLAVARDVAAKVKLERCRAEVCLIKDPRIVVGGNGVSGPSFVDNNELREWAYQTFKAQVLDMETAAVAHVAYANSAPFIAFRSLSDLAGGGPGQNQARAFYPLASDNSAAVVLAFLRALP